MKVLCALFLCCCVAYDVEAYRSGAPLSACDEMIPLHAFDPLPLPAPYNVTATAIDATRYQGTLYYLTTD
jgi:hypothetical protein